MNGLSFITGFIGLWSGIWLSGFSGAVFGGLTGFLLGALIDLGNRVKKLETERDERLRSSIEKPVNPDEQYSKKANYSEPEIIVKQPPETVFPDDRSGEITEVPYHKEECAGKEEIMEDADSEEKQKKPYTEPDIHEEKKSAVIKQAPADPVAKIIGYIWNFFSTGNVVVKVGIVVLFFGVAFLLKYAAEHSILPIELRLCGVAAGGIALLVTGWKKRDSSRISGLSLQGGGIGILYLTVFSAVKLYTLIPPFLALCLMISFVLFSAFIAVLQDAKALAVLASAGGFLAPVLVSTGGGSHLMLFSYYLLLNTGVLSTAWFKSWRELNLTGFAFTFVISAMWGINAYSPENFVTTEPFLIIFFLMYAFISVLFAFRQPPDLKGYVDGALVFGLPLVAFGLQCGIARHFEYGIAISSLCLAVFYVCLALWLWKKGHENMRMLTEAFLAVSVVFATLAIPFAFDRKWIASSWALEGAAMVWIGLKQKRCLARSFGLFLQICAGLTLFSVIHNSHNDVFILNTRCFNNIIMAFAGLFSGFFYHHYSGGLYRWERGLHGAAAFWGALWWFGAGLSEIDRNIMQENRINARLIFMALSSAAFTALRKPLDWAVLAVPPLILVPWMFFTSFYGLLKETSHPFAGFGLVSWTSAILSHFYVLHSIDNNWKTRIAYFWHTAGFVIISMIFSWEAAYFADCIAEGHNTWKLAGWLGVPSAIILFLIRSGSFMEWPAEEFRKAYLSTTPAILGGFLCACFLWASSKNGNPSPLSYIPVLNPADLLQLLVIAVLAVWSRAISVGRMPEPSFFLFKTGSLIILASSGLFVLLNIIVARSVHVWASVNYNAESLYNSFVFQASISILWTLTALFLMPAGSGKGIRKLWFAGAWILGAAVIKLFFVDLGGRGTGERIVSFIAVGIIMLVIGFLSPLPPDSKNDTAETAE